jgi:hypothetical protein
MFEEFLNKYVVVWFTDNSGGLKPRKAKGYLTEIDNNFLKLNDKYYGTIFINLKYIIKISILNAVKMS